MGGSFLKRDNNVCFAFAGWLLMEGRTISETALVNLITMLHTLTHKKKACIYTHKSLIPQTLPHVPPFSLARLLD